MKVANKIIIVGGAAFLLSGEIQAQLLNEKENLHDLDLANESSDLALPPAGDLARHIQHNKGDLLAKKNDLDLDDGKLTDLLDDLLPEDKEELLNDLEDKKNELSEKKDDLLNDLGDSADIKKLAELDEEELSDELPEEAEDLDSEDPLLENNAEAEDEEELNAEDELEEDAEQRELGSRGYKHGRGHYRRRYRYPSNNYYYAQPLYYPYSWGNWGWNSYNSYPYYYNRYPYGYNARAYGRVLRKRARAFIAPSKKGISQPIIAQPIIRSHSKSRPIVIQQSKRPIISSSCGKSKC